MAKIIKVTQELVDQTRRDFEEALAKFKMTNGSFQFSKSFSNIERRAKLIYEPNAWEKQRLLVDHFDKEIAWHGIAHRAGEDEYVIEDIRVYPQTVTGVTVETDQEEYEAWLDQIPDDDFNSLRMQGHSHVNMGVTPSGTDLALYEKMLAQLRSADFYIFVIWNKKGDKMVKIYDLEKNVLFETADVDVSVMGMEWVDSFISDTEPLIKEVKAPAYQYSTKSGFGGGYYGGYEYDYDYGTWFQKGSSAKRKNKKDK